MCSFAMHLCLLILIVWFILVPAEIHSEPNAVTAPCPLESQKKQLILDKLSALQKDIHTFQADFVEKRIIPSFGSPLKYEGRIYCRITGIFFMEYLKPIHSILRILKDEALIFVDGSRTADVVDISSAKGMAGHSELFAIDPAKFSGQILEDENSYILGDVPQAQRKEDRPGQKVSVYLDKSSLLAKKICMADESGDKTVIELSNMRTNVELPESVTNYKLPDGVSINRLDKP